MADVEKISAPVGGRIAADLRSRITDPRGGRPPFLTDSALAMNIGATDTEEPAPVLLELGEALPVWILGADGVARYESSNQPIGLRDAAAATNRWHHQLKLDGKAVAFSRTIVNGDVHSVEEIFYSELPALIQAAIKTADEIISDDKYTRLLFAPAYQLHALWFVNKDDSETSDPVEQEREVLIATAPDESDLEPGTFLSAADFLANLAARRPVEGLIVSNQN